MMVSTSRRIPWHELGFPQVVGIDEVGRGCLAGPVVSCALVLRTHIHDDFFLDSKVLKAEKRIELKKLLEENAVFAIGIASVKEIDEINILQATFLSMRRAVIKLREKINLEDAIHLVDGPYVIPKFAGVEQRAVIDGDALFAPISAASIIAKVYRDHLMSNYDKTHPGYEFGAHKGYGTKVHRKAICELGPTLIHRRSFRGVKEYL